MLNDVQKRRRAEGESGSDTRLTRAPKRQEINKNVLNDLMMKTECRTINKHGITFLNMHYRSDCILGLRDTVNIRYSLFDLSKIHVYSKKGEFLCVAHRVQKVHPMDLLLEECFVHLQDYFLDGTKIESKANKYTFVWKKGIDKNKVKLETKIRELIFQIDYEKLLSDEGIKLQKRRCIESESVLGTDKMERRI